MKTLWLHRHGRERLIVFCNGWGMDGSPFQPLQAYTYDVLMCYDYSDLKLDEDIPAIIGIYAEAHLIGWSMGVWAGQHLFSSSSCQFKNGIAVNGTLCPIHDLYGIPVEIFSSTLEHFNESARLKFYRRMCRDRGNLEAFLTHQPERTIEDQRQELEDLLQKTDCLSADTSIYTEAVIAEKDYILPASNQQRFWRQKKVHLVDGYHFLFYGWNSWDELIHDPGKIRQHQKC
jgi:pimeloyl-[acyl-carrier protein] methyl ester esterase